MTHAWFLVLIILGHTFRIAGPFRQADDCWLRQETMPHSPIAHYTCEEANP